MTATLDDQTPGPMTTPKSRARVPAFVLGAMALGLLIGWFTAPSDDEQTDFESDVAQLVEDYRAAWDAGDGEAVLALMADNGVHTCPLGRFEVSDDDGAALMGAVERLEGDDFVLLSDPIMAGTETPTDVSVYLAIDSPNSRIPGLAQYRIIEQEGELRIAESIFTHL